MKNLFLTALMFGATLVTACGGEPAPPFPVGAQAGGGPSTQPEGIGSRSDAVLGGAAGDFWVGSKCMTLPLIPPTPNDNFGYQVSFKLTTWTGTFSPYVYFYDETMRVPCPFPPAAPPGYHQTQITCPGDIDLTHVGIPGTPYYSNVSDIPCVLQLPIPSRGVLTLVELKIPVDGFRYYSPFAGYPDGFYWIDFSYIRGSIPSQSLDGWYLFFP